MKFFIVLALIVAVAVAAPADPKDAVIVKQFLDNIGVEGYQFGVETSDGKSASEQGQLRNIGTDDEELVVQGQYQYTAPNGQVFLVTYTADKDGFKPTGAHLPV